MLCPLCEAKLTAPDPLKDAYYCEVCDDWWDGIELARIVRGTKNRPHFILVMQEDEPRLPPPDTQQVGGNGSSTPIDPAVIDAAIKKASQAGPYTAGSGLDRDHMRWTPQLDAAVRDANNAIDKVLRPKENSFIYAPIS